MGIHKSWVPGHCDDYILYDGCNICESSWWNFLATRILRWLIHFWKPHAPLIVTQFKVLFKVLSGRTGETSGKPHLGCLLLSCNFVWLYNRIATLPTVTFILYYLSSITAIGEYRTSQFSSLMALSIHNKKYGCRSVLRNFNRGGDGAQKSQS